MSEWRAAKTGVQVEPPDFGTRERRLTAADKPGEHLWVVSAAWALPDPEAAYRGQVHLDAENLIAMGGPGCFKCEREYSRKLAKQPCTGNLEELQP